MPFDQEWEAVHAAKRWGQWPNEHFVRFMERRFRNLGFAARHAVMVLDLGCGAGSNLHYLWRNGFRALGVDASASAVKNAMALRDQLGASYYGGAMCLDVTGITLKDRVADLDIVVDVCTLQHLDLEEACSVVTRLKPMLRKSGAIFSVMSSDGIEGPRKATEPRRANGMEVAAIFRGMKLTIGHLLYASQNDAEDTAHYVIVAEFQTTAVDDV